MAYFHLHSLGVWLMVPISQMEKLSSERLSDQPRDENSQNGREARCLSLPRRLSSLGKLSNELSCHGF